MMSCTLNKKYLFACNTVIQHLKSSTRKAILHTAQSRPPNSVHAHPRHEPQIFFLVLSWPHFNSQNVVAYTYNLIISYCQKNYASNVAV